MGTAESCGQWGLKRPCDPSAPLLKWAGRPHLGLRTPSRGASPWAVRKRFPREPSTVGVQAGRRQPPPIPLRWPLRLKSPSRPLAFATVHPASGLRFRNMADAPGSPLRVLLETGVSVTGPRSPAQAVAEPASPFPLPAPPRLLWPEVTLYPRMQAGRRAGRQPEALPAVCSDPSARAPKSAAAAHLPGPPMPQPPTPARPGLAHPPFLPF